MPIDFDHDDDSRASIRGKIGLPAAAAIAAGLGAFAIFGLDGTASLRAGPIEEAQLLIAGQRYKAVIHCGDTRKNPGKSLLKGFLGANNYGFRAWDDAQARQKAQHGLKAGCRLTSLYRIERSWFSNRDRQFHI